MASKAFGLWTTWLDRLTATAAAISAAAVAALAIVVSLSFAMRTAFQFSVPGLIEFGETLIVLAVFLGLAYGERVQSQIRMTLLTDYIPPRAATVLRAAAMLIATALVVVFGLATTIAAWQSYLRGEVRFGLLRFPIWPARIVIAFGFWMLALQYATKFVQYVVDLIRRDYAIYEHGVRTPLTERRGRATTAGLVEGDGTAGRI